MGQRIAMLGYKDFIDLTKGIIKGAQNEVLIDVYQCFLNECLTTLPEIEERNTDIIITGRANKSVLINETNIPIITFRITPFDILSAVKKAITHSKTIAIAMANFEDLEYDYTILQELLSVELEFISYSTQLELEDKIRKFSEKNGTVIGTSVAVNTAKKFGLYGILIYSLENSIYNSINRAKEIIKFKREEEKQAKEFKSILNSVSDGILATNKQDKITLSNQSMQNLLSSHNLESKYLSDVFPKSFLNNITSNESIQDKIIQHNNNTFNVNRIPINVKGNKLGTVTTFQDVTKIQQIEQKFRLETEAKGLIAKKHFNEIIYVSNLIKKTIQKAKRFAQADSTILITGETGTGKELFAQSIHNESPRSNYPFIAVNCASLPENLLESELFGYDEGAFTGAKKKGKKGIFEIAHNGTIFLDEINSVSLQFQAKLLRVIQEREVRRIGSNKVTPVNIRIIAATNQNLYKLIEENKFREDLFYRLNVLKIVIPPLRNRKNDIIPLTEEFIFKHNRELYYEIKPYLSEICERYLFNLPLKGNIRELYNILERFTIQCELITNKNFSFYKILMADCIEQPYEGDPSEKISIPLKDTYKQTLLEAEKAILKRYINIFDGDKAKVASQIGIGRTTLYRKLNYMNISY
ncbi:Transcriptional regulator containing PAS, AAA-type ATPase, and DNA-binding Fis domains [Lentibacillus halodurans]|uniref:Transcriptional regulator containing PAS, AAA-type ATPase, and DNA-binding Fis domains n=1 Tax=Lentibacillus halodurans TaxID=237679 RepID=A0A1I0ZII2_9BACI|nr:sigma 54-interacting transcriptional regulator [Lentibacillus halodurans]SFB24013.1 Transcriptional regulator containing PAS, AAA-type ATPase, and DNA-binding Fis domains [Lentibacillus halodurans]